MKEIIQEYKKDMMVTLTIEDLGSDGEGIGKLDGYPFFVKDALPGDVIEAKVMKAKKNYAYARLTKILEPSKDRIQPPCGCHKQCGGCQIQALSYEAQLTYKENKVKNHLLRIGGFLEQEIKQVMHPIIGMDEPFHYRNKAQFPFGLDKEGRIVTGFYAGRTHSIIPNTDCILGVSENQIILEHILDYMNKEQIKPYQEETHQGLIRHALIRKGFATGELMVCLVINGGSLPKQEKLLERLQTVPGMTSISYSINREKTNVIMGDTIKTIWGSESIRDFIGTVEFKISPLSFYQVNPVQTEKLYSLALEYANLSGQETVWDLYCGIGTISLFLAQKAKQVYGVEIVPQAIEDAKENAKINHITNAEFYVGKAEEVLPEQYEKHGVYADVIVVDPPRKGCDEVTLQTMLTMKPKRIVYVSCDSATLARDLRILCDGGYELCEVTPVDQFGHTVHVETVCLLSKLHEAKHHVSVKLDMDELDLTASESKATYEEIKKYVAEHYDGMKVTNLYIAQVMRKCGIELAENFNLPKWEGAKGLGDLCSERTGVGTKTAKQPQCPKEKEDAIVEALKHFKMI